MGRYVSNGTDRKQIKLLPPALEEMISEENPVRVIDMLVDSLDLCTLGFRYARPQAVGRKPYNPADLLKLYLYGYFNGVRSSRKLERECGRNIEVMWLLNELKPDYRTIADFRKDNITCLKKVFQHFSLVCNELGLYGKEIIAIDGSKFRANNARKKNLSKGRLAKMLAYFEQAAARYLALLEQGDAGEEGGSAAYSRSELKEKLEKINRRLAALTPLQEQVDKSGEVSLSDPDARLMSANNRGYDVAYNMQTAVDAKNHLIVAVDVTNNPADQGQLYPMAEQAQEELGVKEITVLADKGYYRGECLQQCEDHGITALVAKQNPPATTGNTAYTLDQFQYDKGNDWYICPQGEKLCKVSEDTAKNKLYRTKACKTCRHKEECTKNKRGRQITQGQYQGVMIRTDERLAQNKSRYKQRQRIVEHPFGTIKRSLGYTYFLLRGREKVKGEAILHCFVYNLKRVLNLLGTTKLIAAMRKTAPLAPIRTPAWAVFFYSI